MAEEEIRSTEDVIAEASEKASARMSAVEEVDEPQPEKTPAALPPDKGGNDNPSGDEWWKKLDPQTAQDIRDGKIIPNHRVSEIARERDGLRQELERYKSSGDSEALIKKVRELEARINAPKDEPISEEDRQAKEWLLKQLPEIKSVQELKDAYVKVMEKLNGYEQERQGQEESAHAHFIQGSIDTFEATAKELGIADAKRLGHVFNAIVRSDPALTERWQGRDLSVWKDVRGIYEKEFASGSRRTVTTDLLKAKTAQEKLPKPPVKGGAPASDQPESLINKKGDFDWEKAAERGHARISEG